MSGPHWLGLTLGAVMATIALLGLGRIAVRRRAGDGWRAEDLLHVTMGLAMASVCAGVTVLPATAWLVVFASATGWFVWRAAQGVTRRLGPAPLGNALGHAACGGAMVYMGVAMVPCPTLANLICGAHMAGGSRAMAMSDMTTRWPTLALALGVVMIGGAGFVMVRMGLGHLKGWWAHADRSGAGGVVSIRGLWASPTVVRLSQVAISLTMAGMLLRLPR